MNILCSGTQFLVILDLWGISFHSVVVFGLGKNLLFKSILGRYAVSHQLVLNFDFNFWLSWLSYKKRLSRFAIKKPKWSNLAGAILICIYKISKIHMLKKKIMETRLILVWSYAFFKNQNSMLVCPILVHNRMDLVYL